MSLKIIRLYPITFLITKVLLLIFIPVFFFQKSHAQKAFSLDIDYQFKYNFKSHQNALLLNLKIKNHHILIGPEFTYIPQPLPIADVLYHKNYWGGLLGYRYNFFDKWNLRVYGQFCYSIFNFTYDQYQLGPPQKQTISKITLMNTVHLGVNYRVFKRLSLNVGFGMGSNAGFFLIFDKNFPSINAGLGVLLF